MTVSDRESIAYAFEVTYPQSVRAANVEEYKKMYTESAMWMAPGERDRCGIPDIAEGFLKMIGDKEIEPIFHAEEIKVFGDTGYVIGLSIATIYPKDGSPSKEAKFRAMWLMKKEMGEWKIDRQIWNAKPL